MVYRKTKTNTYPIGNIAKNFYQNFGAGAPGKVGASGVSTQEKDNRPMKGRGGKANFPSSRAGLIQTDEDKQLVSKLLFETLNAYKQERVKSDEELKQRLNDYFTMCGQTGQIPTVEEMCLYTGYTYSTCYDWEVGRNKGFSAETSDIIKKAKHFLGTFDAKLVVSGKLNFLAYCFRAKNYYGMSDKTEYVITPNSQQEAMMSAEDIAKRYIIPEDAIQIEDAPPELPSGNS